MNRGLLSLLASIPIGALGGLIGLGSAEFRLPVLVGPLGYPAKRAVPINLAVSLVTVAAALAIRGRSIPVDSLWPLRDAMVAIIVGAVTAAIWGTSLAHRLSELRLHATVRALLLGIGLLLILEGFLPESLPPLVGSNQTGRIVAGVLLWASHRRGEQPAWSSRRGRLFSAVCPDKSGQALACAGIDDEVVT